MIQQSKITLSGEELQLVNNTEWILTKRIILDKVVLLFGDIAQVEKKFIATQKSWLFNAAVISEAKITRGENYLQLPWVVLDYPRCFGKENIFAVRTMFWWGNFFSCTLHISGSYKILFEQAIIKNIHFLQKNNYFICINNNEWQHHFNTDNYLPADKLPVAEMEKIITGNRFIKVAVKFPLNNWNEMYGLLEKSFTELVQLLKT